MKQQRWEGQGPGRLEGRHAVSMGTKIPRMVQGVRQVPQEKCREFEQGTSAPVAKGPRSPKRHEKNTTGPEAELAVRRQVRCLSEKSYHLRKLLEEQGPQGQPV